MHISFSSSSSFNIICVYWTFSLRPLIIAFFQICSILPRASRLLPTQFCPVLFLFFSRKTTYQNINRFFHCLLSFLRNQIDIDGFPFSRLYFRHYHINFKTKEVDSLASAEIFIVVFLTRNKEKRQRVFFPIFWQICWTIFYFRKQAKNWYAIWRFLKKICYANEAFFNNHLRRVENCEKGNTWYPESKRREMFSETWDLLSVEKGKYYKSLQSDQIDM